MEAVQRIHALLCGSLGADNQIRAAASIHFAEEARQAGYSVALLHVLGSTSLPVGERQMAGIMLKQYVKQRWTCQGKDFEPPVASDQDKAAVRAALPHILGDSNSKIRTATAVCISAIADWDWPEEWPDLVDVLIAALQNGDESAAHGALRCLALLSSEFDEREVPKMAPLLFPRLLAIVSDGNRGVSVQRRALVVVHALVGTLEVMSGASQKQVRDLLTPLIKPWLPVLGAVLSAPIMVLDVGLWGVQMQALRIVLQLVTSFSAVLQSDLNAIMTACWHMFTSSYPVFLASVISEEGAAAAAEAEGAANLDNEDGDLLSFDTLVAQLFELLVAMVGNRRYQKLMRAALPEMVHIAVGYMQMTAEQVNTWSDSVSQYIADEEEETYTARVSGELLIDELCEVFPESAPAALLDAVQRRLHEAQEGRAAGAEEWWKLRESALLALGGVSQRLQGDAMPAHRGRVQALMDDVLSHDLQDGLNNPFLVGRALWVSAKLSAFLRPEQAAAFLRVAVAGLDKLLPPPVRISACRALATLVPLVKRQLHAAATAAGGTGSVLPPLLPQLYSSLVSLLVEAEEETLHVVLETLHAVIKADGEVVASLLPQVAPPVLAAWSASVADPLASEDALDVLRSLAASPACLMPLAQEVLPTLARVLSEPSAHGGTPMLVEASMDFLVVLVRPANMAVVQAVFEQCFAPLMHILMTADDPGWLQNASELTVELVCVGGEALLTWGGAAPGQTLHALLAAVTRLLDPATPESNCVFVGGLVYQLLVSLPSHLMPFLGQLLQVVVTKLVCSNMSMLVTGLIAVLAKLVQIDARQLLDALAAMTVQLPGGQSASGLETVLRLWLEHHNDLRLQGPTRHKLCVVALGQILEARHPMLEQMMVRGKRVEASSASTSFSGAQTRSQTRQAGGEQWTQVAAPVKMAAVLAEALAEAQSLETEDWGGLCSDGDDDEEEVEEWEEADAEPAGASGRHEGQGAAAAAGIHGSAALGLNLTLHGSSITAGQSGLLDMAMRNSPTLEAAVLGGADGFDEARRHAGDPLVDLDLNKYLVEFILRLASSQPATLQAALPLLAPRAAQSVGGILTPSSA